MSEIQLNSPVNRVLGPQANGRAIASPSAFATAAADLHARALAEERRLL
ncbi:MAG TPA: hypothetical protein VLK82_16440 [Candidatus Tectomicrobia bacterium]|nr:hypothetical protein [Candidatus Tectomicrobia bacterium]